MQNLLTRCRAKIWHLLEILISAVRKWEECTALEYEKPLVLLEGDPVWTTHELYVV